MEFLFSVDVEPDLRSNKFKGVKDGLPSLSSLLLKYGIKATFFTTCDCMEEYPSLFKKLVKEGHEIALHGYRHERFDTLSSEEKEDQLKKSFACFKKYLQTKPKGFRAPQHSLDNETPALLKKYGLKYDSSKTPGNIMLLRHLLKIDSNKKEVFVNLFSKFKPSIISPGLFEIPRASFLVSTGGFELKAYPIGYYKTILPLYQIFNLPLVFVMHSWDLIDIPDSKTSKLCSSKEFLKRLDSFLSYTSKKGNYMRMEDFYEKNKDS